MTCTRLTFPNGARGFVCTSGPPAKVVPCKACSRPSTKLCDGPPPYGVRRATCSAPLCDACAVSTGPELDLCPGCAAGPEETGEVAGVLVYTARISSRDQDAFDITAKSGGVQGAPFAPSWEILRPALAARTQALAMIAESKREPQHRTFHEGRALAIEDAAWAAYVPAYRLEMLASWRQHRAAWEALLARRRVVLVCYCTDPARCHRRLLAGFLAKMGAVDQGELVAEARQASLF
jgi:hypothetical protein